VVRGAELFTGFYFNIKELRELSIFSSRVKLAMEAGIRLTIKLPYFNIKKLRGVKLLFLCSKKILAMEAGNLLSY
jgi:hypothetical protein